MSANGIVRIWSVKLAQAQGDGMVGGLAFAEEEVVALGVFDACEKALARWKPRKKEKPLQLVPTKVEMIAEARA